MKDSNSTTNASAAANDKSANGSASEKRSTKKDNANIKSSTKKTKKQDSNFKSPRPPIIGQVSSAKDKRKSSASTKKVPSDKASVHINNDGEDMTRQSS